MLKKYNESSYKERTKRYSIVTVFICILILNKTDYPIWAYVVTLSILIGSILFNLFKWKSKESLKGVSKKEPLRNTMFAIIAYLVLIYPSNLWFSIIYYSVCVTVILYSYYNKKNGNTKSISN
ncbi:hypothetical protein D8M05_12015 [Oceanobacillus bengalensis]|uniref:Uncharacterized protein n=1 Tax=Oceanobacillus bengalensis TaxID=1435466 RepID=A0A494YX22_9BACI|nr:hypothetical protein D8M05_12015 [Oceanobacillus bengalensis]